MSHHHLPLSCSSAMTFLGLEPRIVFLPTSQLEYLLNLLCLTKKDLNFRLLNTKFCVENSFSSFHYHIVQQLLNSGKTHITVLETTQEEIQGRDTNI
jgi:hypothetical protein